MCCNTGLLSGPRGSGPAASAEISRNEGWQRHTKNRHLQSQPEPHDRAHAVRCAPKSITRNALAISDLNSLALRRFTADSHPTHVRSGSGSCSGSTCCAQSQRNAAECWRTRAFSHRRCPAGARTVHAQRCVHSWGRKAQEKSKKQEEGRAPGGADRRACQTRSVPS